MDLYTYLKALKMGRSGSLFEDLVAIKRKTGSVIKTEFAAIASFITKRAQTAIAVEVQLDPIQDLHGYDKPWSGGNGKNKFDGEWELGSIDGQGQNVENTTNIRTKNYIPVVGGKSYAVSWSTQSLYILYYAYKADKSFSRYMSAQTANPHTLTLNDDEAYIRFYTYDNTTEPTNYQIELGSTASDFEPYSNVCPISGRTEVVTIVSPTTSASDGTTYTTDLGRTVYGGQLDVVSGVLNVTKAYALLNDASKWIERSGTVNYEYVEDFNRKFYSDSYTGLICSMAQVSPNARLTARWIEATQKRFGIYDADGAISFDTVKSLSSEGKISICYDIEPQTYQLTPTEVSLLLGNNNVWSDGDVSVTYVG